MQFISWNIDSLNAAIQHKSPRGEMTWATLQAIAKAQPDVVAIQETKSPISGMTGPQEKVIHELFPDYYVYQNTSTERKGYSGTMMLSKTAPISVDTPSIDAPDGMDTEGRILTLEFENAFVSTVYTPNSGRDLDRLADRQAWDEKYQAYIESLDAKKPVIFSGDMNVAHQEIDLKNPKTNRRSAGFTNEERLGFTNLLSAGFVDTFRYQHPDTIEVYSWWAQMSKTSKINNTGWRIDYYLVSERLTDNIEESGMLDTGDRQDHAPVTLSLKNFEL
ncbi:exodeoxyribonuclease III [Weissella ceti]|uniref:Exodeoxyribonuclease III n=1 Tax=Weissella ceti TaxID=759620 RepID=A0ABT3E4S0_9LACO|nr:exodeoxyribonuclease III [Weissella ceti]MCW0953397.1 exodeoxyribonuclease III [Weissella ceti]QVK12001.1 exodeoxyribonuclease III [Weissella ceti]